MEAHEITGERFDQIIDQELYLKPMSQYDSAVYHIIMARCESDINGFEDIFCHLFDEEGIIELELCLALIEEAELAKAFGSIREMLVKNQMQIGSIRSLREKLSDDDKQIFDQVEKFVTENHKMWNLDEKIVSILNNKQ